MTKKSPLEPSQQELLLWEVDIKLPLQKLLYRVDEAASVLQISNNQVRNLTDSGELEAVLVSASTEPERRHVRISGRSIEEFINRRRKAVT